MTVVEVLESSTIMVDVIMTGSPVIDIADVGVAGPPGKSIHVGSTPPISPAIDDLWVDTT